MKFKSRKDIYFNAFLGITISLLLSLLGLQIFFIGFEKPISLFMILLLSSGIGLLLWTAFYTEYELTENRLSYKSGPVKGELNIKNIHEIIVGKSLFSGIRPATALNGLILKIGKYEELYISPESNQAFIEKILEYNDQIKITK